MLLKNTNTNLYFTGVSKAVENINSTIAPALVGQVRQWFSLLVCVFLLLICYWCESFLTCSHLFRMYLWLSKRESTRWCLTWTAQRTNVSDGSHALNCNCFTYFVSLFKIIVVWHYRASPIKCNACAVSVYFVR